MSAASYEHVCKNCNASFKSKRSDATFCNARCTAQYAREEGYHRDRVHSERSEVHEKPCEHCATPFFYNVYAARGGERVPQYCSSRCRTAAYRARKKDSFFDGGANRWQDARNDKTDRKGTKHTSQGTEREKQDYQDARRTEDQRSRARAEQTHKDTSQKTTKKDTSQSARGKDTSQGVDPRFLSKDAYVVLGVTYVSTQAQIKKAYMALIRKYHPDICKDPNATRISQAVNAAWDKLKKH